MIVLLVGKAGSGKDTVGRILERKHGAPNIAFADPIKALASIVFDFSSLQLYGPSQLRNDPVVVDWEHAANSVRTDGMSWVDTTLSEIGKAAKVRDAHDRLVQWFEGIRSMAEGGSVTPRCVLQTLGTEWGRNQVDRDLWIKIGIVSANTAQREEMAPFAVITDGRFENEITAIRASGGKIIRIVDPHQTIRSVHVSEVEQESIPDSAFDQIIVNDKTKGVESLEAQLKDFWL